MNRAAIAALCAAACWMLVPSPALAKKETTISCGMPVFESIRVANDLTCPDGPVLDVAAPGVTIDLNGHTLTVAPLGNDAVIDNSAVNPVPHGYPNVKIRNGFVDGGFYGIVLGDNADRNQIQDVTVTNAASDGIHAEGLDRLRISDNDVTGSGGGGIVLHDVINSKISNNNTTHNEGDGITVLAVFSVSSGNELRRNEANLNGTYGIAVNSTDSGTVLKGNEANQNGFGGIFAGDGVTDGGRNEASGNLGPDCSHNIHCN